jgi:hypothetical protein
MIHGHAIASAHRTFDLLDEVQRAQQAFGGRDVVGVPGEHRVAVPTQRSMRLGETAGYRAGDGAGTPALSFPLDEASQLCESHRHGRASVRWLGGPDLFRRTRLEQPGHERGSHRFGAVVEVEAVHGVEASPWMHDAERLPDEIASDALHPGDDQCAVGQPIADRLQPPDGVGMQA